MQPATTIGSIAVFACAITSLTQAQDRTLLMSSHVTDQIMEFDPSTGEFIRAIGSSDEIGGPIGLVWSTSTCELLVACELIDAVVAFDLATGQMTRTFASGGGLWRPNDLLIAPNGNLLVTSRSSNEILEFDGVTGNFERQFASTAGIGPPTSMLLNPANGNLLVSMLNRNQILEFDQSGAYLGVFAEYQSDVQAVSVGLNGNIIAFAHSADQIVEFDATTGAYERVIVDGPIIAGPQNALFGPNGSLYVASNVNRWVAEYDGANGDFIGIAAQGNGLNYPAGLLFSPLPCIADLNNDCVLDLSDVTTFVGSFVLQDPVADLAEPFGVFDLADIGAFIEAFNAGCP